MKAVLFGGLTAAALILVLNSCGKDPVDPAPAPTPIPSVGIDEPLLITASSPMVPNSNSNQHTFELASVPIVQSGEFNDIEIKYTSRDACDEDVELWNVDDNTWVQIAWGPTMVCSPVLTDYWRTLSERELDAREYLDSGDRLQMRTWAMSPVLRVLLINTDYDPIVLSQMDVDATGVHVNGSTIWLAADNLSRVTTGGNQLPDVNTTAPGHHGLAWDGERFWTLARPPVGVERFQGITQQGVQDREFDGHPDFAVENGMVFANNLLWAVRDGGFELLGIDLQSSLQQGYVDFPERLYLNTGGAVAVTHNGTDFYVAYPSTIKKVSMSGIELEDHPLTVERLVDLAWVEGALWIVHAGPRGVQTGGLFVSKFDL
jgi:hypothetical protein